jgi:hypothetical protein
MPMAMKPAFWDKTDGLSFGGIFINVAPIELDANAAAARFAWRGTAMQLSASLSTGAGQHEPLFRYRGGPEPLETLPARIIRFGHLFAERCERLAADRGLVFATSSRTAGPARAGFGQN